MIRVLTLIVGCFFLIVSFIKPASNIPALKVYPKKLSAWGIFDGNMAKLIPAKGVVPYSLNTPLYSDYAEKLRFVRLPIGSKVSYNATTVLDFPIGTLLVKAFYYSADFRVPGKNKNIVETRLLIYETEGWKALTYIWNNEQTEAELEIAGDDKQISFIDKEGKNQQLRYVVPNQNQCKGCHNVNDKIMPIGPTVAQLNSKYQYASGIKNQLTFWKEHKMMDQLPVLSSVPKTAVWDNPSTGNLNARARAYLAVNCAHCHRREGPAQTSGLFLTETEKDITAIGINKPPVAAGKGSGERMVDIKPGDANGSIIWYRMQTTNPGERMPELGRNLLHKEGLALIKEWIDKMK